MGTTVRAVPGPGHRSAAVGACGPCRGPFRRAPRGRPANTKRAGAAFHVKRRPGPLWAGIAPG
ncbi:hypothetical protein HOK021_00910 [Streptomyces hygroscopicus]|nr:hypothetical protein HOK021_00910 [Streptomyces hygroscopicus]